MQYMSCPGAVKKWGISERRVQRLREGNPILGVSKIGYTWLIPKNAKKPADARFKKRTKGDVSLENNIDN